MAKWARGLLRPISTANQAILQLFVVDPSSGRSLGYIDGLRAVAVMLVVSLHVWGWAPTRLIIPLPFSTGLDITPIISHGGYGVQLFFVLSGFLLAQSFLKSAYRGDPRPSVKQYFILRVCRIVPAYYVCLFLMLLLFVPADVPVGFVYSKDGLFTLIAHLFFVQFLFPLSSNSFMLDGPMWTLTMEMMFYVLLPFVVYWFARKRWMISLPVAALISLGWFYACRTVFQPYVAAVYNYAQTKPFFRGSFDHAAAQNFFQWQFPSQAIVFAFGVTAANLYVWHSLATNKGPVLRALTGKVAGIVYFALGSALELMTVYPGNPVFTLLASQAAAETAASNSTFGYYLTKPAVGLGFALMVVGLALGMNWLRTIFSFTPLRLIGITSYSIYLWHAPLIANFRRFPGVASLSTDQFFRQLYTQTTLGVFALACVMFLAVERPFMVIGRRAVRRARERAATGGVPGGAPGASVSPPPATPESGVLDGPTLILPRIPVASRQR